MRTVREGESVCHTTKPVEPVPGEIENKRGREKRKEERRVWRVKVWRTSVEEFRQGGNKKGGSVGSCLKTVYAKATQRWLVRTLQSDVRRQRSKQKRPHTSFIVSILLKLSGKKGYHLRVFFPHAHSAGFLASRSRR